MNSLNFSKCCLLLFVLFIALLFTGCMDKKAAAEAPIKPNVLFIAIDDLRPQLGCYGHDEMRTPNIDKLAREGVLFTNAFCHFAACGASRSTVMSGLRPTRQRFVNWDASVTKDAPGTITLPQAFKENGYYTVSNGKVFHDLHDTEQASWSEPAFTLVHKHLETHDPDSLNYTSKKTNRGPFFESPDVSDNTYIDGQVCNKTIEDLRRLKKMDKPFFLACGFVRPHLPFYAPKKYWDMYDRDEIELASNRFRPVNAPKALQSSREFDSYHYRGTTYNSDQFHRTARHGYYACVSYSDANVGRLLAELDRLGLRENTIVVLWGDHGWTLGEHNFWAKYTLLKEPLNAPLIISAPGYKQNLKTDGIVEFVDIYPTLCELAGVPLPSHMEGLSAAPLMADPSRPWKKAAFATDGRGDTVITRDFAYTSYDRKGFTGRMLFDLKNDPQENVNVVDDPKYTQEAEQLDQLLEDGWRQALP